MPNVVDDRRRALDALASQLKTKVVDVVNAAWTSQVTGAAKSVTDVWPDKLVASQTKLQQALAAYRPNVEVEPPVTPRDAAVKVVTDAADQHGKDIAATSSALVDAKNYKSETEKATIDGARDAMDRAAIALTSWVGDFRRFDASVVAQPQPTPTPTPTPTPPPQSRITFAVVANGTPYPMVVRATIVSPSDWASSSNRPDAAFANVTIDAFGHTRAQLDLGARASSAKYRLEIVPAISPSTTLVIECDQVAAFGTLVYQPLPMEGGKSRFVAYASAHPDPPQLEIVVAEQ